MFLLLTEKVTKMLTFHEIEKSKQITGALHRNMGATEMHFLLSKTE